MYATHTEDSFSEGTIYPGRAIAVIGLLLVVAALLSYI